MTRTILAALAALMIPMSAAAQNPHDHALNDRGKRFMGFDQRATAHHFILLKDGGSIEVTAKDAGDATSIGQIRGHLKHIASAFSSGDFDVPALIHDRPVPGVEAMKQRPRELSFAYEEIDRGARVRIRGTTAEALAAVHAFLRFQITDHKTGDSLEVR
jgi:hypothetical protein